VVDARDRPQRKCGVIAALAIAWGGIVLLPFVVLARRVAAAEHLVGVVGPGDDAAAPPRVGSPRLLRSLAAKAAAFPPLRTVARVARAPHRSRRRRRLDDEVVRQVAVAVDLVGLAVAAGHTPFLAVELSALWCPPLVATELNAIVRACSLGQAFDDALREAGRRTPPLRSLTETLRTTNRLGSPAAPALARLASEQRAELRRRAEARARTVPVRLCFPLVGCILPAFALLTVVPAVVTGITR
jgi:Flp pilus assembly protein TadB